MTVFTLALLLVVAYACLAPAVRALRGRRRFGLEDRAGAVAGVATAVTGTVAARQLLPWETLPAALWAIAVAAAVVALLGAAAAWSRLPALTRPRWRRAAGTGLEVLVDVALVGVMLIG